MTPLIIADIEELDGLPIFAAVLFDKDGYLLDQLAFTFDSLEHSTLIIEEMIERQGIKTADLWTSNTELFAVMLQAIGISPHIKHSSDTTDTKKLVEHSSEWLRTRFASEFEQAIEQRLPPAGRWRKWAVLLLQRLLKQLGADKYDFGI